MYMQHTTKKLDKSQIEITITVSPEEYDKNLKHAATRISERVAIKGFRKGKAPYDIIKREVGEMQVMQEALERIVQSSFYTIVEQEKIETIGMPDIKIEKMAPGNNLVYIATVALLPEVKLVDLEKISIEKKVKEVTTKDIDDVIENLTKMQAKEIEKDGPAEKDDIIIIDMDLFKDGLAFEGGAAKDYKVYLSENQHIPGFNDALTGLKKGDTKEFEVPFPKDYYNKQLAGNNGLFKIIVKQVMTREFPEINDEFAKALGQDSVEKLKELLKINLSAEADKKAEEQAEIEIFDHVIDASKFDEIPDVLIDAERKKMFYELQKDLERNGITIEQYLNDIKKKEEELFEDFKQQAEKRAKAALISRHVARQHDITVSDEELQQEIDMMKQTYKDMPEYMENLQKKEVHESLRNMLANKKVVALLKEKVLKKSEKKNKKIEDEDKK